MGKLIFSLFSLFGKLLGLVHKFNNRSDKGFKKLDANHFQIRRIRSHISLNMKSLLFIPFTVVLLSCSKVDQEIVVELRAESITVNSIPTTDLEETLNQFSCTKDTKLMLRAIGGLPYSVIESIMEKIQKSGCMNLIDFDRL